MAGSIRKRGERSWELRGYTGRHDKTGKKQYVSRTVKGSKRDAEKELARLVTRVDDGVVTDHRRRLPINHRPTNSPSMGQRGIATTPHRRSRFLVQRTSP